MSTAFKLEQHPVHLGLGASAEKLPAFDGTMDWYERYGRDFANDDGAEGRLIAVHQFDEDWPTWEIHPVGAELVYVISGAMTLIQEIADEHVEVALAAGDAAINPPGVWHTAKVPSSCSALFVTAGQGTLNEVR